MTDKAYYFDRNGAPIDLQTWADYSADPDYRFLAKTTLPNGRWVATIWIGIAPPIDTWEPCLFETTVFEAAPGKGERLRAIEDRRYRTEAEALAGHAELCRDYMDS